MARGLRRTAATHASTTASVAVPAAGLSPVAPLRSAARTWNSDAPPSLGGSPVVLQLRVTEVDAAFERMVAAGAVVVFPLMDFCGDRMGRLREPFGHLWLISQRLEELSAEEVQERRDEWTPGQPPKTS